MNVQKVALEESLAYLQTEGEHVINCPSYDLDYIVIVAVT